MWWQRGHPTGKEKVFGRWDLCSQTYWETVTSPPGCLLRYTMDVCDPTLELYSRLPIESEEGWPPMMT
jgi:hypothetical protein